MKSHVSEKPKEKIVYPMLMDYCGAVNCEFTVLMTSSRVGMVVYRSESCMWSMGHYSTSWLMNMFVLSKREITLENS